MEPKGPPPSHEETLGAQAGVPKAIADEYAKTGKTPKTDWRNKAATEPKRGTRAANEAGANAGGESESESDVADLNATDAVEHVNRMRSKEKLQAVVDSDSRSSVRDAAQARLDSLG